MVDDAGTLIDMATRNTYDYVSEVCPLLDSLSDENEQLKKELKAKDKVIEMYYKLMELKE